MASAVQAVVSSLQANHAAIEIHPAGSPDYDALKKAMIITAARPTAIARPKNADEVAAIVRTCREHQAGFSVRTGGHSCLGDTLVDGTLTIDMRSIDYVEVSEDKKSAKVGGGILIGKLLSDLAEHDLVTPCGTLSSVGYVGWSTLGGYGPFSSMYGLGADQIVGAKLVSNTGEAYDADEDLLKGIRGAGPLFGPIVELTIKVYPLTEILSSTIVFESHDPVSTWSTLTADIQKLTLPDPLKVQFIAMEFPGVGKVTTMLLSWVSADHEEGRKWFDQMAGLAPHTMNVSTCTTPAVLVVENDKLVVQGVYGRSYTASFREWTPEIAKIIGKRSTDFPSASCMLCVHSLRPREGNSPSVFGAREPHQMVEIIAMGPDEDTAAESIVWGQQVRDELRGTDAANLVGSSYISLEGYADADPEKTYNEHLPALVELKRKYDGENIFRHAVPRVTP